jgi:hypothetical protein
LHRLPLVLHNPLILHAFPTGIGVAQLHFQLGDTPKGGKMKSPNYVAVLAILNALLHRVSETLPLIDQATRELGHGEIPANARAAK